MSSLIKRRSEPSSPGQRFSQGELYGMSPEPPPGGMVRIMNWRSLAMLGDRSCLTRYAGPRSRLGLSARLRTYLAPGFALPEVLSNSELIGTPSARRILVRLFSEGLEMPRSI